VQHRLRRIEVHTDRTALRDRGSSGVRELRAELVVDRARLEAGAIEARGGVERQDAQQDDDDDQLGQRQAGGIPSPRAVSARGSGQREGRGDPGVISSTRR
jgi:hypothetical protein